MATASTLQPPSRTWPAAALAALLLAVPLALCAASAQAQAAAQSQTWQYKSFKKNGMGGTYSAERFQVGTLTLEEKDGRASVRLVAGAMDACMRGDIPAQVTRSAETTVIELKFTLAGCEPVRYVIRNDGSGGRREHQRNERWADDTFDHALTPVAP